MKRFISLCLGEPERKDTVIVKEEGENEDGLLCKQGKGSKWTKDGKSVEIPPRIMTHKVGFTAMLTIMDITANDAGIYCCSKTTDAGVYKELTEIVVISKFKLFRIEIKRTQHTIFYTVLF